MRWIQAGFRRSYGSEKPGTTMRNLFGQVDGTTNPAPDSAEHERVVWGDGQRIFRRAYNTMPLRAREESRIQG